MHEDIWLEHAQQVHGAVFLLLQSHHSVASAAQIYTHQKGESLSFSARPVPGHDGRVGLPVRCRLLVLLAVEGDPAAALCLPEGVAHHRDWLHWRLKVLILSLLQFARRQGQQQRRKKRKGILSTPKCHSIALIASPRPSHVSLIKTLLPPRPPLSSSSSFAS